jgi:ketopantoate reductase
MQRRRAGQHDRGRYRGRRAPRQSACFKAEQSGDIRATLWTKFAFVCAVAGTTAAVRLL